MAGEGHAEAMKRLVLFLVVVLAFGLVWWMGGDANRSKAPDDRLAGHARALCQIAEAGIEHPDDGVRKMFRYHGERGPDMARDWAELLVLIERIDDDRAHDARARKAAKRIHGQLGQCAPTMERFGRAVENDPAASARLERGMKRLNRTLEILFGGGGRDLLRAPFGDVARLESLLGAGPR